MFTRREFLKLCAAAAAGTCLSEILLFDLHKANANNGPRPVVVWLELGSCTGDTISLDNSSSPSLRELLNKVIDLRYHWTFMNVESSNAINVLRKTVQEHTGKFILVVEGSVMQADNGSWNNISFENGRMHSGISVLKEIGPKAAHVIAIGSCAAFGGPVSAKPNPSKATGVQEILDNKVINTPGCPCHPDWFIGTLYHLINYGLPELDTYNRPKLFYGRLLHDLCQRRSYFDKGIFAKNIGEPWCLYNVGCRGPRTYADCPIREWNGSNNWPVGCSTPCIGCVEPGFPDVSMPFFERHPDIYLPGFTAPLDKAALVVGGAALGGIALHLGTSLLTRRIQKNLVESSLPLRNSEETPPPQNPTGGGAINKHTVRTVRPKKLSRRLRK